MTARLSRLRAAQQAKSDERFAERFAHQWTQMRAERVQEEEKPPVIDAGPSNFSRAQVPWAFDLAAAWAWLLVVIGAAGSLGASAVATRDSSRWMAM